MRAADARIGQLLGGKYRVQQLLALGGMGFVYAARHEVTGRAVALKLLRPELVGRADLVERVSREARLAVDASHPNVVEVLDAGADAAGVPYLVLERLYGEPLEALLDRPLSLRSTLEALVPVCNALAALHEAGIVHRDVKPSNIFLSRDDAGRVTPKLLDFGIAKALEGAGSTLTGVTLGTPAYMAPEQLLCCSAASPASDVWSLAVVSVRCLTGRLPFADLAKRGLLTLGSAARPSELDGVPEPLARVLGAALRFEPGERPVNGGELRAQLLAALEQVGPGQAWPDVSSISFAEHESELARTLKALVSSAGSRGGADVHALGRPQDVLTRTLSRAWHSIATLRSAWGGALALLLALVLALLTALSLIQRARSVRMQTLALEPDALGVARASGSSVPEPSPVVTRPAEREPGAAAGAAAATAPPLTGLPLTGPPRAERERPVRGPRRDVRSPASARPATPLEHALEKPGTPQLSPLQPAVGANRSPIIE